MILLTLRYFNTGVCCWQYFNVLQQSLGWRRALGMALHPKQERYKSERWKGLSQLSVSWWIGTFTGHWKWHPERGGHGRMAASAAAGGAGWQPRCWARAGAESIHCPQSPFVPARRSLWPEHRSVGPAQGAALTLHKHVFMCFHC